MTINPFIRLAASYPIDQRAARLDYRIGNVRNGTK